ncbi:MAG: PHP domain-containing protein [Patescibacteria group bacterium]
MQIIRWILLILLILQIIALPFWPRTARLIFRKRPKRKIWNLLIDGSSYSVLLTLLLLPMLTLSLKIARADVGKTLESREFVIQYVEPPMWDIRGQIHVHCYLSHDSDGTLEEITEAAKKNGVRWIILTDHIGQLPQPTSGVGSPTSSVGAGNYPDEVNGVLLIYGCERNNDEGTSVFRASLKDPKETLHLHGHVESFSASADSKWFYQKEDTDPIIHWDALEMVNFHANILDNKLGALGSLIFYPESLYNNITGLIPKNFDYWQKLAKREGRPIPIFGAPDAHQNQKYLGVQADPYELTLGLISTHIWLKNGQELNQKSIFEAIKSGHTYIAFDYLGDPTGFTFYAEKMNGDRCMTGEAMLTPKYLSVWAPESNTGVTTKFYCNNILVGEIPGSMTYMPKPDPGFWRVELWKRGRPWIISGQILVK